MAIVSSRFLQDEQVRMVEAEAEMARNEEKREPVTRPPETVEVPVTLLQQMQARLDALEQLQRVEKEKADDLHPKQVYDAAWEARVKEIDQTPAARTQQASDRQYGVKGPRWTVRLDSTREDGKPGPNVSEWPAVTISANSPEEAEARWMKLCGVRKHDYRLVAEPANQAA